MLLVFFNSYFFLFQVNQLDHLIEESKQKNTNKLRKEYDRLVEGLSLSAPESGAPLADQVGGFYIEEGGLERRIFLN